MVDEVITKQELIDAQKDAQSLDEFINGGDEQVVVTRLLKEYPTLANAIRQIYEKGGKFYPTLADANADIANIRTDVYVITGDNGAYYKATTGATSLTKSPYDPLTQANTYTDSKVQVVDNTIGIIKKPNTLPTVKQFPSPTSGTWIRNLDSYKGTILPVKAGETYKIEASANNEGSIIYQLTTDDIASLPNIIDQTKILVIEKDAVVDVTMDSTTKFLWCSYNIGIAPIKLVSPKSVSLVGDSVLLKSNLNDSLTSSSTVDALTAKQGQVLDGKIADINNKLDNYVDFSSYPPQSYWASATSSQWIQVAGFLGIVIPVKPGATYEIKANASSKGSSVYQIKESSIANVITKNGTILDLTKLTSFTAGQIKNVTIADGYNYLWVSFKEGVDDSLPQSIKPVDNKIVFASDVVNNLERGGVDLPLAAEQGKVLKSSADKLAVSIAGIQDRSKMSLRSSTFDELDVMLDNGRYYKSDGSFKYYNTDNPNVSSVELTLAINDVLEFDYHPILGTTLWHKTADLNGWALLSNANYSASELLSHKFTAYTAMTVILTGALLETVKINGVAIPSNTPIIAKSAGAALKTSPSYRVEDLGFGRSGEVQVNKGDVIRITDGVKGNVAILYSRPENPGFHLEAFHIASDYPSDTVEWVAPTAVKVILNGSLSTKFFIKKVDYLEHVIINKSGSKSVSELTTINLPQLETVFATHLNYILKTTVIDGIPKIAVSQDLGKTWSYMPNIEEGVTNYHFFTGGTILLSSPSKCYWTDDYVTLNESTLLDADGSTFVAPPDSHHFFGQQNSDKPMFVDDVEVYAWGDYTITGTNPSVWYSKDYGRTVKRALNLRYANIGGTTVNVRHVHKVYYHAAKQDFYIMTGDAGSEINLLKGKYTPSTDTWAFSIIGQGYDYKFGNMFCDDYYAYITTDYTDAERKDKRGLLRVGLQHLGDPTKFRYAYKAPVGTWAAGHPYRFVKDRNGNKVILAELGGKGYIAVATEGFDFKQIPIYPSKVLSFIIGANDIGDIYCKVNDHGAELSVNSGQFLTGGTINLTKALRNAGITNFMKGELVLSDLVGVSE